MATVGRKNKYKTHVEPYLAEIAEWAKTMTEQQIAKKLGVSYRSFSDYKTQNPPLFLAIKNGRSDLVVKLKSRLIDKAMGIRYTELETTKEDGVITKEVRREKFLPPDVAAMNLLLKNYDKENWANDPQSLELRKQELELRKKQIEKDDWDV